MKRKMEIYPLGLVLASAFIHVVYTIILAKAYEAGDLSLVYPLARSAPLFVTLWAILFLDERLTVGGLMGIFLVVLGAYFIGFRTLQWREFTKPLFSLKDRPYQLALLTALLVSLYSIVDKIGVNRMYPFIFYYLLLLPRLTLYIPYVFKTKFASVIPEWRRNRRDILLVAVIQFLGYLLILYAMTLTKLGYIVAIRQISVVFAVLMGTALLKEKYGLVRLLASSFIFLGVFLIGVKG